jgi:hypothetical protein
MPSVNRPGRGRPGVLTPAGDRLARRKIVCYTSSPRSTIDRALLGELARLAWQTVLEVQRAGLGRRDVVPGMVGVIHTFGQLVHFHPHIHAIVTDGAFTPDGAFISMPVTDTEPYLRLWQQKVFGLLLGKGKITADLVDQMRRWRHSGFSVDHRVTLAAGDTAGLERLAQYMLRCPFSLARMIRVTDDGKVLYLANEAWLPAFPRPGQRPSVPRGQPQLPGLRPAGLPGRAHPAHPRHGAASHPPIRLVFEQDPRMPRRKGRQGPDYWRDDRRWAPGLADLRGSTPAMGPAHQARL